MRFKRQMIIDFYQIEIPANSKTNFSKILNQTVSGNNEYDRNEKRDDDVFRLRNAVDNDGLWSGELLRIKMGELPKKAKIRGAVSSLGLADDEGLGGEVNFIYDEKTNIVILQRNRNYFSSGAFAWYFERRSGIAPIDLKPIIKPSSLLKLSKMKEHRKIEVAFAAVKNVKGLSGESEGVNSLLNVVEYFNAPRASCIVSMGRDEGSLQKVIEFVKSCLGMLNKEEAPKINKLKVSGKDDETMVIDLIEDRLIVSETVILDKDRTISESERSRAILRAWNANKVDLTRLYS